MGVMVAGDTTARGLDRWRGRSARRGAAGGGAGVKRRFWEEDVGAVVRSCEAPTARTCARSRPTGVRGAARLATPDECVRVLASRPGACRRWATAWSARR